MDEPGVKRANELMETEDQLQEQMREEFRRRLAVRLQERLEATERGLPEVHGLKKKGRSGCTCKAPLAKSRSRR